MLGFQPPAIGEEEIAAVAETLRSGWLTTGPKAAELERRFAEFVEAEHVLAVASGTAALHLSLLAVGVEPGDEVITSPITWPATANVIVHAGATPVFADVRDSDLNIDPDHVADLVTDRTKAIMPVHLAGPVARPGSAARPRHPGRRGRGARGGERLPRTQDRRPVRRDVLLALCDEEHRRRRGRADLDERRRVAAAIEDLRLMRRGDGSLYDIVVPGYKANLSDVLAAIALCQLDKVDRARRDPQAPVRRLRRGGRRAGRHRAARARPPRHARLPPLRRANRRRPGWSDP